MDNGRLDNFDVPEKDDENILSSVGDIQNDLMQGEIVVSEAVDLKPQPEDPSINEEDDSYAKIFGAMTEQTEKPFVSRFKSWIRTVALIIALIFLPEQISWAFNYNPLVLWGDNFSQKIAAVDPSASDEELVSARIASSVARLLKEVAYKPNTRIKLELPNASDDKGVSAKHILIDSQAAFTNDRIMDYAAWLKNAEIHPLNCGVYAINDILQEKKVGVTLEEISVLSLLVDILGDVIKPGDAKLKTSLFAINKIVQSYGLNFKAVKIDPAQMQSLTPPFIANFKSEHFVTVKSIDDGIVYYKDIGRVASLPLDEFTSKMTGFVLANVIENVKPSMMEEVPDSMAAFVWGSKWVDQTDQLPGFMSIGDALTGAVLQAVMIYIGSFLGPLGIVGSIFASAAGQFANTIVSICVMKGACSEESAMILSTAITVALVVAAGSAVDAAGEGVKAGGGNTVSEAGPKVVGPGTEALANGVSQNIGTMATNVSTTIANALTDVATVVSEACNTFTTALASAWDSFTSLFEGMFETAVAEGTKGAVVSETVKTAVVGEVVKLSAGELAMVAAKGFAKGFVVGAIKGYLMGEISEKVDDLLGDSVSQGVKDTIISMASTVGSNMLTAGIVAGFDELTDGAMGLGDAIDPGGKKGTLGEQGSGFGTRVLGSMKNVWTQSQGDFGRTVVSSLVKFGAIEAGLVEENSLAAEAIGQLAGMAYQVSGNTKRELRQKLTDVEMEKAKLNSDEFSGQSTDGGPEMSMLSPDQAYEIENQVSVQLALKPEQVQDYVNSLSDEAVVAELNAYSPTLVGNIWQKNIARVALTGGAGIAIGLAVDSIEGKKDADYTASGRKTNQMLGRALMFLGGVAVSGATAVAFDDREPAERDAGYTDLFTAPVAKAAKDYGVATNPLLSYNSDGGMEMSFSGFEMMDGMVSMTGWTPGKVQQLKAVREQIEVQMKEAEGGAEPTTLMGAATYNPSTEGPVTDEMVLNKYITVAGDQLDPGYTSANYYIDNMSSLLGSRLINPENNVLIASSEYVLGGAGEGTQSAGLGYGLQARTLKDEVVNNTPRLFIDKLVSDGQTPGVEHVGEMVSAGAVLNGSSGFYQVDADGNAKMNFVERDAGENGTTYLGFNRGTGDAGNLYVTTTEGGKVFVATKDGFDAATVTKAKEIHEDKKSVGQTAKASLDTAGTSGDAEKLNNQRTSLLSA
ncbi:cysteine peptidase family C39 domain-containing protein [Candidatus Omnitrophota bacterium]